TPCGGGSSRRAGAGSRTGYGTERGRSSPCLALGGVRRLRGQLAEAGGLFDGAVEGARLSGNALSLAGNLLNRSLTALAAGDVETGLAAAEESGELTRPPRQR